MGYSNLMLAAFGIGGVFLHNLIKLNDLNKKLDGNINLGKYLMLERFAIIISLCVVAIAILAKTEIKQLEAVANWLGLAFVSIGYMAQSIVVAVMGRSQKYVDSLNKKD